MKILIVSFYPPYVIGGGEVVVQRLAEGLAARGHDVVVASPAGRGGAEQKAINGVRVHYVPVKNIYFSTKPTKRPALVKSVWHVLDTYNPLMARALMRILKVERPQVVNTQNASGFSPAIWRAIKKGGLPVVNTVHSYYLICPRQMFRSGRLCSSACFDCRVHRAPRRRLSRYVDVATGVSKFIMEQYSREGFFPAAEKMLIHNSCEVPKGIASSACGDGRLRFGYLGRLHPTKGVDLLIRSFLELPRGQAELLIAGNGPPDYERELKTLADGHPEVRWLGFVPTQELLSRVDALVVPSYWHDPAPLVVQEALAHGLPVIGANRGGIPELMGEGTGWTFDPDELGALAQAMKRAVESRSELAAMSGRAICRAKQFSADAMIDGYLQAFAYAIEKNRKSTREH